MPIKADNFNAPAIFGRVLSLQGADKNKGHTEDPDKNVRSVKTGQCKKAGPENTGRRIKAFMKQHTVFRHLDGQKKRAEQHGQKQPDLHAFFFVIFGAFKTGLTMTLTSLVVVIIGFILTSEFSKVFNQIFMILIIGLLFDIMNTWLTNTSLLKWYMEAKHIQ